MFCQMLLRVNSFLLPWLYCLLMISFFNIKHSNILLQTNDAKIFNSIKSLMDAINLKNDLISFSELCNLNGVA